MERRQFNNTDRSNQADSNRTGRKDSKPNTGKGAEAALATWKKVESVRLWWRAVRR